MLNDPVSKLFKRDGNIFTENINVVKFVKLLQSIIFRNMATMATSLSGRILARNVKFSPGNLSLRLISTSKKNRETATINDVLEKSEAKAEVKVKKVCFQTFSLITKPPDILFAKSRSKNT